MSSNFEKIFKKLQPEESRQPQDSSDSFAALDWLKSNFKGEER